MSKICAKCEKPVYPTEELKCLDKVWHKACFKCWDCGMTLNMKNYKGYDRKPYCVAHYPQTKATVVAETPELARLTQASKNQSQAKYHEDFEKNIKGSKIQVADDPETQRLKQLNAIVSQVEYKGLKEKVNEMETHRQNAVAQDHEVRPDAAARYRGSLNEDSASSNWSSPYAERNVSHSVAYTSTGKVEAPLARKVGSIVDYDPGATPSLNPAYQPVGISMRQRQEWEETVPISNSTPYQHYAVQQQQQREQQQLREQQQREQMQREQQQQDQLQREQQQREQQQREQQLREQQQREQQMREKQLRDQQMLEQQIREQQRLKEQQMMLEQQMRQQQQQPQAYRVQPGHSRTGPVYQAMYDYDAQDDDEVGCRENDIIVNVEPIDEGWMFGTIERTGMRGMLPANYVKRIQ